MSRSTGLPQHLLVVDPRQEHADRIIGYARQAGLAVRASSADTMEEAQRQIESHAPDLIVIGHAGSDGWAFEEALARFTAQGYCPLVVGDRLDDLVVARAYSLGAQGVLPASSSDALVAAMRLGLSVSADRAALKKAEAIQAETATREESLLDSSRDPVAYIHEGMHIRANQAYIDFFGIEDADEVEGLPFLDLVAPADAKNAKTCLRACSQGDIPPSGLDLTLVSASHGEIAVHVEISKASYEGEPCLQLTLRTEASSQSKSAPSEISGITGLESSPAAWWDRVQATLKTAPVSALLIMGLRHPRQVFAEISLRDRARAWCALRTRIWEVVREVVDPAVDQGAMVEIGTGLFGLLLPASDAEHALSISQSLHKHLSTGHLQVDGHEFRTVMGVSGVAVGTSIGWQDEQEAMSTLENRLPEALAAGSLHWFDPSTTDRDYQRRRRVIAETIGSALDNPSILRLHYRPILSLAAESFPFYETSVSVIGPDKQQLQPEEVRELVSGQGLGGVLDRAFARAISQAILAKSGRNNLKVLVPVNRETLKTETSRVEFLGELKSVSIHVMVQVALSDIVAFPDRYEAFIKAAAALGIGVCIGNVSDPDALEQTLSSTSPAFVLFSSEWAGDTLRDSDRLKAFRRMVSQVHDAKAGTVACFVSDSQSMSALFSAGVGYASGDFLSPEMESMDAEFNN